MFFEDAQVGSQELDIALTSRDKGQKDSVPLCGVPHFAAETYISKLLQKGYKVALCDQVEDPKLAKGIVKREVVRVFTPGLVTDAIHLGTGENNYLMGFCAEGEVFGLAFLDISTGELKACQISGFEPFLNEALRNEPKEILSLKRFQEHPCFEGFKKNFENGLITYFGRSKIRCPSLLSMRMEREFNPPKSTLGCPSRSHGPSLCRGESEKTALPYPSPLFLSGPGFYGHR